MLLVDYRDGSKELLKPLLAMGLPAEEATLEFGDVAFIGRGAGGAQVDVGIEFKTLRECVGAMRTQRLEGHQAPGMRDTYDFRWLLVEGELLYRSNGLLLRRAGRGRLKPMPGSMSVGEFTKRLLTMHLCGGLNPWLVPTRKDTLKWLEAIYRTWTDEDLDKHKSHLGIYRAPKIVTDSDFRTFVRGLPEVGRSAARAAEQQFRTIRRAMNATPHEWATLELVDDKGKGRRLGEKAAQRIHDFLEAER